MEKLRAMSAQIEMAEAADHIDTLQNLVDKRIKYNQTYVSGLYSRICGEDLSKCYNAYLHLCSRVDRILETNFDISPRGDMNRVRPTGSNLISLLTSSLYTITWLNSEYYHAKFPAEKIDPNDKARVNQISDYEYLDDNLKKAIGYFEKWTVKTRFESCRMCTSCGGDYPTYGGEVLINPYGNYKFGEQCSGELREEGGATQICCSASQNFRCDYCGGWCSESQPSQILFKGYNDGFYESYNEWGPYLMRDFGCFEGAHTQSLDD
jgi:hypothetical protein